MKKLFAFMSILVVGLVLVACGGDDESTNGDGGAEATRDIETLTIYFVPSRDPEEIISATEPLGDLLIAELEEAGFNVSNIDIHVGTTFEAAGQALHAGSADIAFLPGSTYVLFDDGVSVILTATRAGLSKDYGTPAEWNDGLPTLPTDEQVMSYRSLILAGPSPRGRELAEIVNSGGELTWEDLDGANWGHMSPASPAGFVHPTLWLQQNFGMNLTDLSSGVQSESFAASFANLAAEQFDVVTVFADGRRNFEEQWTTEFGRELSIWDEVDVIGVTDPIFNDTISVSDNSDVMSPELVEALQNAFINIANTPEGLEIIAIYSHEGYQIATSADYDLERDAQALIRELQEN